MIGNSKLLPYLDYNEKQDDFSILTHHLSYAEVFTYKKASANTKASGFRLITES